ncbi:hypothetical protein ZOSMA_99G00210 [Zostera marina]|uniref:Ycf49-like protein n=1 Tax=Zostera marina TaxID=29655 RepID=A0A0K9NH52_ZOSMR|nr:hypothetical protein ZOSMA_99G00210 [Zostera marina]
MAVTPHYHLSTLLTPVALSSSPVTPKSIIHRGQLPLPLRIEAVLHGAKLAFVSSVAAATIFPLCASAAEPSNALSLPTWAIHVSSVVEWVTAMLLVWEYGEKSEYEAWKGLSWGMVPLLGGAFCACTWHFFYNSESLEILVVLQAALTVIGNFTMCIAAFRIYRSCQKG